MGINKSLIPVIELFQTVFMNSWCAFICRARGTPVDPEMNNRLLGFNDNYIFLAGNPRNPLEKNWILKCRIGQED